jgi:hypothetical protein
VLLPDAEKIGRVAKNEGTESYSCSKRAVNSRIKPLSLGGSRMILPAAETPP